MPDANAQLLPYHCIMALATTTTAPPSAARRLKPQKVQIATMQAPLSKGTEDFNGDDNE